MTRRNASSNGQPSDPPGGSDYFDPILFHNGERQRYHGYVTDIIVEEAIRWIGDGGDRPFFAYVPTNAPHSPYLVPDAYREPYAARGLGDRDARIYGMITNIDDNVGRLLEGERLGAGHVDVVRRQESAP